MTSNSQLEDRSFLDKNTDQVNTNEVQMRFKPIYRRNILNNKHKSVVIGMYTVHTRNKHSYLYLRRNK